MTIRRKRDHTYHHNDLRNALVEEAVAILKEASESTFTLRDLARRVGVSHAAPYAHFTDRRALLSAVAVRGFQELRLQMIEAKAAASNPLAAFIDMGVAYVLYGWHNAAHYRLMFQSPELADDRDLPELREASAEAYAVLEQSVRAGHDSGVVTSGDPATDTFVSWSHVHGMTSLLIDRHEFLGISTDDEVQAIARAALERVLQVFSHGGSAGVPEIPTIIRA